MKISEKIKNFRLKKNFTQKDLVSSSGISQSKLSKIENDEILNPHPDDLRKIASSLGVNIQDLLPGDPTAQLITVTRPQSDEEAILYKYYIQFANISDSDGKYSMFKKLYEDMQIFITRKENYLNDIQEH